jgi:hypothetical protein
VPSRQEKALVFLLRFGGAVLLLAWLAVFLPTEWMAANHRWIGLGSFPDAPLTQYLTRSIAALYGIHGGLVLLLSTNVRRYVPVITYVSIMNVVFGAFVLGIDVYAGMPWYWTLIEGPPVAAIGTAQLLLLRGVPRGGSQSQ